VRAAYCCVQLIDRVVQGPKRKKQKTAAGSGGDGEFILCGTDNFES
jgi:hypothetical protein